MGKKGTKRKTRWRVLPIGDDGSEDEESRDEERGGRERHWKPRPRFHQHHQGQHGTYGTYGSSTSGQEKRTFNEDEYTRITTPRQDVLFKKGYLGRKRPTADPAGSNGLSNGASTNGSTNGDGTLHNGESLDADCGDGSDMMDEQAYYYPGAFVDPATGMYYVNGGYEMYDPYTGAVTVVVGPGPGMMGLPPMGLPPMEFFSPRLPPPPHGPPHGPPPHMAPMQSDYCYMHGRKRFSVDSQNCSGPSSESAGSGPPSGPPSSPQECDSAGLPSGPSPGPSPGPPPGPLPPMGPMPYPPHPHYMYPYMFGAPLYSLDGVSVQGGPPYGPVCDVNAVNKRRKKKRRRKRRRGGGTDDGSEESSSEDNQLEEGEGAGLSSLSSQSAEDSQATPTDSDAFPEFVPKAVDPATVAASTLNGDASVWEPSILTPPQTPTACVLTEHKESPVSVQPTEALEVSESASPITTCSAADELPAAEDTTEQPKPTPSEATPTPSPEERPVEAPAPEETPAKEPSSPSAVETVEKSAEPSPATEEAEETLPLADTAAEAHSTPSDTSAVIREATPVPVEEPQTLPEPVKEVEAIAKVKNGVKHSAPKVNGEVLCVSKKAVEQSTTPLVNGKDVLEFESSLTLPVEKVPVCNGEVICLQRAVESNPETVLSQSIDISGDSGKEKSVQRTETFDVIFNNNNDLKQKGKVNQNKNAVNEVTVNGDKIVTATNGKVKKVRNNSSPDHRESNGFAEKARLSESPSGDDVSEAAAERGEGDEQTTPAQTKSEPVSRTKEAKSAKRKSKKRAPAKTDLSSKAGGVNGVMASTPPPPGPSASDPAPKPAEGVPDDLGFSLRPEPSIAWGRKNETKVRPVDDVLLQALVGSVQSAPLSAETKVDIPVELETPAPTPVAPRLEAEAEAEAEPVLVAEPQTEPKGSRLTPSSAHRPNRAKKWRQKERAPTPGRELTASSSSLSSSDEADEGENVIFMSPLVATATTTTTAPAVEQAQAEQRESPLRITEAVTAWLRDHESEEVLVPAVEHAAVSDSESGTDDEEEDDDENAQQPKNAIGNPFRASSHSSTTSTTPALGPGADVEERVASVDEPEAEAAWDTLCDPSLFVAKYYRLGEDPQDTMPAVVALELRPDLEVKHQRRIRSSMSPEKKGLSALCDQHDSGVHSDESGDEHHTPTKDKDMQAQAEEFAAKSAYLLRQLKGQSPGVPCGGICCSLQ